MTDRGVRFAEYGDTGDYAGARRARRAFRLCVASCVLFTGVLWLSERFLRYDDAERLYLSSLTQEFESARPLLRQAVKIDAETRKFPTPKYMAALAVREEDDLIILAYEKAYSLDPGNSFLAIRYGCRLALDEQVAAARDRFREAAAHPPPNALPSYVEAAMLPMIAEGNGELSESLALVARTNNSGNKVIFPRPVWSSSLPQRGMWYAMLQRRIVDECCAPLYQYAARVVGCADREIAGERIQYWDSWLETLQVMGERILASAEPGVAQATAGIRMQLDAIERRAQIGEIKGGGPDEALTSRRVRLESALAKLSAFEHTRHSRIQRDKAKYGFPLDLCWMGGALFIGAYLFSYIVSKACRVGSKSWTLSHGALEKSVFIAAFVLLVALLCLVMLFQRLPSVETAWFDGVKRLWYGAVFALVGFGVLFPALRLPRVKEVSRKVGKLEELDDIIRSARRSRRVAYISLVRRYFGILNGVFWCAISTWVVVYRVLVSLYPWQVNLLTPGLLEEETELVRQVLSLLS